MDMEDKRYIAIDLKSFYASVECVERGMNPMTTNLVVADSARTEKTICLAVTPSLKAYGISGRARLFEVVQRIKEENRKRRLAAGGYSSQSSVDAVELAKHPEYRIDYIVAPPRMARYMEISTKIYQIYLRPVSPEDIHVYSIDEVFIDATPYLKSSGETARAFAERIILDVLSQTGITAAAGIGTNLYLCKVAMDVMAKRVEADENGVRIAELDEAGYRRQLWSHRPLTDFWRVGRGYARALEANGLYTMGDVARCSVGDVHSYYNEGLLYRLFGVNAELLIDHAWGWEPCTISDIKAYRPESNSLGSGQVLQHPYSFEKAKLIVREMIDLLVLELVEKGLVTDQIVLTVGYDAENLSAEGRDGAYEGEVRVDFYGRKIPKHAHGTANLGQYSSSTKKITVETVALFERIVNPKLTVRRINVTANHVISEEQAKNLPQENEQISFFVDYEAEERKRNEEKLSQEREKQMQRAVIEIKKKYGKNAILKGMSFEEKATAKIRNTLIGGHNGGEEQ